MPSSLVTTFRQHYPRGSLLSEVLAIHDGVFVVRVSVAVEGDLISQAMAANNSLELAEDIACNRALERLALDSVSDAVAPKPQGESEAHVPELPAGPPEPAAVQVISPSEGAQVIPPSQKQKDVQPASQTVSSNGSSVMAASPVEAGGDPAAEPQSSLVQFPTHKNSVPPQSPSSAATGQQDSQAMPQPVLKLATPPADQHSEPDPGVNDPEFNPWNAVEEAHGGSNVTADPIDLSDIIAQTDVELQRLGWDVNQGREFLEKTYGKRSRHDLTDEELLEFLLYLESQPMPT